MKKRKNENTCIDCRIVLTMSFWWYTLTYLFLISSLHRDYAIILTYHFHLSIVPFIYLPNSIFSTSKLYLHFAKILFHWKWNLIWLLNLFTLLNIIILKRYTIPVYICICTLYLLYLNKNLKFSENSLSLSIIKCHNLEVMQFYEKSILSVIKSSDFKTKLNFDKYFTLILNKLIFRSNQLSNSGIW